MSETEQPEADCKQDWTLEDVQNWLRGRRWDDARADGK